jgi:hypothetical protein
MRARLWPTVAAPAARARILLTVAALAMLLYTVGAPVSNGG